MTNHGNHGRGVTRYFVQNPDGTQFAFRLGHGREKNALDTLIQSGATGCTFYDDPAPRWAGNIFKLRCRGLIIKTEREKHGGAHPGTHARYVLLSMVEKVAGGSF